MADFDEVDSIMFELDFVTCIGMMQGKTYDESVDQAKVWIREARGDEPE